MGELLEMAENFWAELRRRTHTSFAILIIPFGSRILQVLMAGLKLRFSSLASEHV